MMCHYLLLSVLVFWKSMLSGLSATGSRLRGSSDLVSLISICSRSICDWISLHSSLLPRFARLRMELGSYVLRVSCLDFGVGEWPIFVSIAIELRPHVSQPLKDQRFKFWASVSQDDISVLGICLPR